MAGFVSCLGSNNNHANGAVCGWRGLELVISRFRRFKRVTMVVGSLEGHRTAGRGPASRSRPKAMCNTMDSACIDKTCWIGRTIDVIGYRGFWGFVGGPPCPPQQGLPDAKTHLCVEAAST